MNTLFARLKILAVCGRYSSLGVAVWLAVASSAVFATPLLAQQPRSHIGCVYPAGGQLGTTFEAVIAGQHISDIKEVYVSGKGVQATISEMIAPISGGERSRLLIQLEELLAKKGVVKNDFREWERMRGISKNTKTPATKGDEATSDLEEKQLAEFKKKYAGATWTGEDDSRVAEIRKKLTVGVRKLANPATSELAVVQITIASDAQPGRRELRIATSETLSNPLVFDVGELPEFSKPISKKIAELKSDATKPRTIPRWRTAGKEPIVTLPIVINGQIMPSEKDRYRFQAAKGQRLVIAVNARDLIPYISDAVPGWFQATLGLYDAQGKELAYNDDFRFSPDPVLYYEIPTDGEYVAEIKDAVFRGREDFVYRLTIGEIPYVTSIFPLGGREGTETAVELTGWNLPQARLVVDNSNRTTGVYMLSAPLLKGIFNAVPFAVDALPEHQEKEPNNWPVNAQQVTLPLIINGRIGRPNDVDVFSFAGRAGDEIVAEVYARRLNSPLDSVLRLTDAQGKQLAMNDDHEDKGSGLNTHHADSYLRATLPADGTYYIHLTDMQHQGGPEFAYRLRISAPQPDFELRTVPSSLVVSAPLPDPELRTVPSSLAAQSTTTALLTLYALRKDGYSGEIVISLKDGPEDAILSGGLIPAGEDQVRLTLTVPSNTSREPFPLKLEGRALIGGREVVRSVVPAEDMMQAFEYRHLVPAQELAMVVMGSTVGKNNARQYPLKIVNQETLKIPAGGTAKVELSSPMPLSQVLGRLQLKLSDAPDGIAIQKVLPSRAGMEIVFQSDATKIKPGLKGNLIVTMEGGGTTASRGKKPPPSSRAIATLPAISFEIVER